MGTIGIIGLGLMGGSIGLALKRRNLADAEIIGYDRDREVATRAQKFGAVDRTVPTAAALVQKAPLVIIAVPTVSVRKVMDEIATNLVEGSVVTDVSSTKGDVLRWARDSLPAKAHFVGGHPMAGKEASGPEAAQADLFDGRPYAIVPSVNADPDAVNAVVGLARVVGARPFFIDADEHDAYAAAISHVPLVASVALFSLARASNAWPELANMAGPGFKDLTRLASGSPEMAHDIFLTNRDNVNHWLNRYIEELLRIRDLINAEDSQILYKALAETQIERDTYLEKPPMREEVGGSPDMPSSSDTFMDMIIGTKWAERAKELTKGFDDRLRQQEQEARLRRRDD